MEQKNVKQIEEYIKNYKSIQELEDFFKEELIFPPCITMKKHQISEVFNDFHHHDLYELLYIVSGKVLYSVENQKYELSPGDLMIISPSTLHKLIKINTNPCQRIVLTFTENYAKSLSTSNTNILDVFTMAKNKGIHKISIQHNLKHKFENYLNTMAKLQFSKDFGADLFYNTCFLQCIFTIYGAINEIKEDVNTSIMQNKNTLIVQVVDYIKDNLSNKILIDDIAKHLSISPSRLSHIFKEQTGMSILNFIIKKRMIYAKELIKQGEAFVNIAHKCGMKDYTSFFRSFKKEYGITPKEYAKQVN